MNKLFVAIATASALVVLAATPASATVHDLAVTAGTSTTTTPTLIGPYTFGPGDTGPCTNYVTDTDGFTIDETGTGTPTSTTVTAVSLTSSQNSGTPTAPYSVVITKHTGTNTGTVSSAGAMSQSVSLRVEFRAGCTSTGTLVCTFQMNGTLTGTATAHPLAVSTNVHLAGSALVSIVPFLPCNAPFNGPITTYVTLTSLTLHVTT